MLLDLIKVRVVAPLDPCPVGLSTHVDLDHRLDVVSGKLAAFYDPDSDLLGKTRSLEVDKLSAVSIKLCVTNSDRLC